MASNCKAYCATKFPAMPAAAERVVAAGRAYLKRPEAEAEIAAAVAMAAAKEAGAKSPNDADMADANCGGGCGGGGGGCGGGRGGGGGSARPRVVTSIVRLLHQNNECLVESRRYTQQLPWLEAGARCRMLFHRP